jgi:hypothetical protein
MTTDQQEARLSPASLMWDIFWRSVFWYTATGAVLGGLYGCSFVALAIFSFDAGDGVGDVPVWAIRMMVIFCGPLHGEHGLRLPGVEPERAARDLPGRTTAWWN